MGACGRIVCKIVVGFIFILSSMPPLLCQEYVVNVYDGEYQGEPKPCKVVFVDLESKSIANSIIIADNGHLLSKRPLRVNRNGYSYYASGILKGCYCKNSLIGQRITNVVIIDPLTKQIIFSYADSNLTIETFRQIGGDLAFISGRSNVGQGRDLHGEFDLGQNFRFSLRNRRPLDYVPYLYSNLRDFRFFEPIDLSSNLYRSGLADRRFVLKTDATRTELLDSLEVNNDPIRSIIFAVKDSLMYVFHQNHEFYGKFRQKSNQDDWIQSHVIIYNIGDFSPLDSLTISDYPPGDYIIGDFGVADIVDDYIVYYFAQPGGLEAYTPAMLFIFDTRTNEASWLRVGWR